MSILLFPGQGSQHEGMGKDLFEGFPESRIYFDQANEILEFELSQIMFEGSSDDLLKTSVTQPAVFLNSFIRYKLFEKEFSPKAVAGHSLGEFTSLVANNCLSFEDGLKLVALRAQAMQEACDNTTGTMAAILGLEDPIVEEICSSTPGEVVAANYNCPGQLVISGEVNAIEAAVNNATEKGARRAIVLNVNGAFHSPLMEGARKSLEQAIANTAFKSPTIPIYQNVTAQKESDPEKIKENLIAQLTSPVRWTQTMQNMIADGHETYIEFGAKVLSGFFRRVDRTLNVSQK